MRIYIAYILTSVLNYYPIVVFWGISLAPIGFLGSVILFTVAAPIFIYNVRIGLIIGLIGCLLMLPYSFVIVKGVFDDGFLNSGILVAVFPTVLISLSTYFTVKPLLSNSRTISGLPTNSIVKAILAGIPIALFVLYIILYGKYWSWEMLRA